MAVSEEHYFKEDFSDEFDYDYAVENGQLEFDFPEKIENIYKILGRVRKYKYSVINDYPIDCYNYRIKESLPVPPSYIDTFICDIAVHCHKKLKTKMAKEESPIRIINEEIDEKIIGKGIRIYRKRGWHRIAGYRPYTHWYFIRSLTKAERKLLIKEIVEYIKTNGIMDIE